MNRRWLLLVIFGVSFTGLSTLVVRLHVTQLAYEFDALKSYERSLQEEQLRLRAELAEDLSPSKLSHPEFIEPEPSQVVRLP